MRITGEKDLFSTLADLESSYADLGRAEAAVCFKTMAYYEGKQWRRLNTPIPYTTSGGTTQLRPEYNPDRPDLRVVDNITTELALRVAARTFPSTMEVDVFPGEREFGAGATLRQKVAEDAINCAIDMSAFLQARRAANLNRTIMGDYAVGLGITCQPRTLTVRGRETVAYDHVFKCFTADPTKFVLDPFEASGNLEDHDIVVYRDVWTVNRLSRIYPEAMKGLDESRMQTVAQLAPFENTIAEITDSRLFAQYQRYSKTKGARVYQIHVKGEGGRFDRMFIVIDAGYTAAITHEGKKLVNGDDPTSPFGGSGLPFALYHAFQRAESPWSISDVLMLVDPQNRINLAKTIHFRHQNQYAGYKWIVDRRFFKTGEVEDALNQLNNRVAGAIVGEPNSQMGIEGPRTAQIPIPSPALLDTADREYQRATDMVGRPPVTQGAVKSHVPDSTFQTAINQADQIANVRVMQDVETDAKFLMMMLGTTIKCVQSQSPTIIGGLMRRGFGEEELGLMIAMNPEDPGLNIVVRQSTVRNRSHEMRRQEVLNAAQTQLLSPLRVRAALSELDSEIVTQDKGMSREANKAAVAVMMGQEWVPMPLGEWSEFFIDAFREAMIDARAKNDPEAQARLMRAVQGQTQMRVQEQIMADPQAQMQMQQQAAMAAQPQPEEEESPDVADVPGLLAALNL